MSKEGAKMFKQMSRRHHQNHEDGIVVPNPTYQSRAQSKLGFQKNTSVINEKFNKSITSFREVVSPPIVQASMPMKIFKKARDM